MGISAVILTKNEEHQIRRCLDSLKDWVNEIIVVDDESTDTTVAIASGEYNAKVKVHPLREAFDHQRNLGMKIATQEWILQMDADEVISPQARQEIVQAVANPQGHDAFELLRQDCVNGVPLKYVGGCYQVKLLRRTAGKYEGNIHEAVRIKGSVGRIQATVWHYAINSVSQMMERQNRYSDLESRKYLQENPGLQIRQIKKKLIFKPFKIFIKHYIKHGGYKDGVPGLMWCMVHSLHPAMFWLKVLEGLQFKDGK